MRILKSERDFRYVAFCTFLVSFVSALTTILFLSYADSRIAEDAQILYIDKNELSQVKVGRSFLSVALDASVIADGFYNFNMSDEKLIKRARYLSPGFIRIGGNLADKLYFSSTSEETDTSIQDFYRAKFCLEDFDYLAAPNFTMTGRQWLRLVKFAQVTGLQIIFDLNALMRFKNGSWDYRNAENFIKYSHDRNILLDWELGNEPNSFEHKFGEAVSPVQLATDFNVLKNILNKYPLYRTSDLVGPDVTRPLDDHRESQLYLQEFLNHVGDSVDAITWHQYYLNGRTAQAIDFLSPETFDLLRTQISRAREIINFSSLAGKPIWLGETSSAYGGGAPNLSDTFIGSFLWIDKLGLSAEMGIKAIMRQSLFKGYYALLDDNYDPNPDWWVSVLYKHLVGEGVVPHYTIVSPKIRLYVHCSKTENDQYPNSITVFGLNVDEIHTKIKIEGLFPNEINSSLVTHTYALTGDEQLTSRGIKLNGNLLIMSQDNTLPPIVPKIEHNKSFLSMPPYSIVFWVIPGTPVRACL